MARGRKAVYVADGETADLDGLSIPFDLIRTAPPIDVSRQGIVVHDTYAILRDADGIGYRVTLRVVRDAKSDAEQSLIDSAAEAQAAKARQRVEDEQDKREREINAAVGHAMKGTVAAVDNLAALGKAMPVLRELAGVAKTFA